MPEGFTYVVLGAGRQGTAAAYDLARWGGAQQVRLADRHLEAAQRAAARVNRLIGRPVAEAAPVDAGDIAAVERVLVGADACLSAVPYPFNPVITQAALRARTHLCDLGGNLEIAREQHRFHQAALEAGVSVIPNCGQVPGLGTTLMVRAIELLDEADEVRMWDGGLPQRPRPPFNYLLTFNIAGLTNEYAEPAVFLRDGRITIMAPMSEPEIVEFPPPIGRLEAFIAGGGTDTMPWTYEGRLRVLQNKTLRHPGHYAQLRAFYDLGLWRQDPIRVGAVEVVPREVFHALFEPLVTFPDDPDMVIVSVQALGRKGGAPAEARVEVIDYFDAVTGFSAMERCTGWSAASVAAMMARGQTPRGAAGVERMVPAGPFVEELKRRGLPVTERIGHASTATAHS